MLSSIYPFVITVQLLMNCIVLMYLSPVLYEGVTFKSQDFVLEKIQYLLQIFLKLVSEVLDLGLSMKFQIQETWHLPTSLTILTCFMHYILLTFFLILIVSVLSFNHAVYFTFCCNRLCKFPLSFSPICSAYIFWNISQIFSEISQIPCRAVVGYVRP